MSRMLNELKNLLAGIIFLGVLLAAIFGIIIAAQHHPRIFGTALFLFLAWAIGNLWRGESN